MIKYIAILAFSTLLGIGMMKLLYEVLYIVADEKAGSQDIWGIIIFGSALGFLLGLIWLIKNRVKRK